MSENEGHAWGNDWKNIETAPLDGDFLVFVDDGALTYCKVVFRSITGHFSDGWETYDATHWQHLPEPPTRQEKEA